MTILVDTSVWIDFLRGQDTPQRHFLAEQIAQDEDVCTCGVVLTEVLRGIKDDGEFRQVRSLMNGLTYLPAPREMYVFAAELYRLAARRGRTIRGTVDCVIAATAIHHSVPLLARDRDMACLQGISQLQLVKVPD